MRDFNLKDRTKPGGKNYESSDLRAFLFTQYSIFTRHHDSTTSTTPKSSQIPSRQINSSTHQPINPSTNYFIPRIATKIRKSSKLLQRELISTKTATRNCQEDSARVPNPPRPPTTTPKAPKETPFKLLSRQSRTLPDNKIYRQRSRAPTNYNRRQAYNGYRGVSG